MTKDNRVVYCTFENFRKVFFLQTSHRRSFVIIKSSRNGKINILFTDIAKSCNRCKFLTSQICLLMLFAKIKFLTKFPDLQYFPDEYNGTCT